MSVEKITEDNFEKEVLNSDKKVLIDFYADWCGPCRMMSPIIDELEEEIHNVKFVKINVDEAENIARKYGIMSIPTFIVIEKGLEKSKVIGMQTKEKIKTLLEE